MEEAAPEGHSSAFDWDRRGVGRGGRLLAGLAKATAVVEQPVDAASRPSRRNPLHQFGRIGGMLFVVVCVTGVYLTMFFRFGFDASYEAVANLEASAPGRLVRAVHRYASIALVVVGAGHGWRAFVQGRFSFPRRTAWVTGIVMVVGLWLAGVTGYWLIWDERAEVLNAALARVLGTFPTGLDFMLDFVLTNAAGSGWAFILILFLIHVGISAAFAGLLWLHLRHMARRRWVPSAFWTATVIGSLVVAALVVPTGMAPQADGASLVGRISVDPFFLFLIPPAVSWPPAIVWGGLTVVVAAVVAVPWLMGVRAGPVVVDAERCTGCTWCAADCPYGAIEMVDNPADNHHLHLATITAERCVGCGICLGSCPVQALVMDGREPRTMWSDIDRAAAAGGPVVFVCARRASGSVDDGRKVVVPCVGAVPPVAWEHAVDVGSAVTLDGCASEDCTYLEGSALTVARWSGVRQPHLRRAYAGAAVEVLSDGSAPSAGEDRVDVAAALPVVVMVLAVALVSMWAAGADYDVGDADTAVLAISLDHRAGVPLVGEPATDAEPTGAQPRLTVTIDGEIRFDRLLQTSSVDAPNTALLLERFEFPAGTHQVDVVLTDDPDTPGRSVFSDVVSVAAGEAVVLELRDQPVVVAADAGRRIFESTSRSTRSGCVICHSLEPDRTLVGPTLFGIADVAADRVAGLDAEAYLRQSILDPDAYVVDGFPEGQMLSNLDDILTPVEIDQLVAYLLTLEAES